MYPGENQRPSVVNEGIGKQSSAGTEITTLKKKKKGDNLKMNECYN